MKTMIVGFLSVIGLLAHGTNGPSPATASRKLIVEPAASAIQTNKETNLSGGDGAPTSESQLLKLNPPLTLAQQLKTFPEQNRQSPPEKQKERLQELKHAIASTSPELDISEVRRDAEISESRLSHKHNGKLYKFSGLILETTPHDITIVTKNTEIVCSFANTGWKTENLKAGNYFFGCGFFDAYNEKGTIKQISMLDCYSIENFYKLRTTPLSEKEKEQSLKDFEDDQGYKLLRDLKLQ